MTHPSDEKKDRRRAGGLIFGSALIAAIGVGALAYTSTNAAFSGTTGNTANDFTAATVTLIDDDFGGTNLTVGNMIPGDISAGCIEVEYTGSTTDLAGLRVYGSSAGALQPDLNLTVQHGALGSTCAAPGALSTVYTGLLSGLGTNWAGGTSGPTPSATPQPVAWLLAVELDAATLNALQGATATADFTWEVRSN